MKAIALNNYGPAEELRFQDIPAPIPSAEQALVKVHATAVNHIDIGKAAGVFRNVFPLKFPWIPGYDFAGLIDSGALKINMGTVYPIQQAAEAWNDLQGKRVSKKEKKNGRIVLQIQ
ncbi:MAG TPA: hypothetical protein VNS58_30045 [Puia sp.]|nr:hypothetical protein [Puia sp.]